MSNDWCSALGISTPTVEAVVGHTEASTYALLLVALLERGAPMTLPQVAARIASAGAGGEAAILASLKRCRPGRPPVYRDRDHYHLDPHDDELDLWVFRLGLRPPRVNPSPSQPINNSPLPGPEVPLKAAELDEAWREQSLSGWSHQRLVLAVIDALGRPGSPAEIVAAVSSRTRWHGLTAGSQGLGRASSAVAVLDDGRWAIRAGATDTLLGVRRAVRDRVAMLRRYGAGRPSAGALDAARRVAEMERAQHAEHLARLRRLIVVSFPRTKPTALALLDVGERTVVSYLGDDLAAARTRIAEYDLIAAQDVHALLSSMAIEPHKRRVAELGPPQKTIQIDRRGRTLKITTAMLVKGSCGISRPFGDPSVLDRYLVKGEHTRFRRRLEADAKSLCALYEYGRLHGGVRLCWGFLDELLPVPWVHGDEPRLYHYAERACELGVPLEVVVGNTAGWDAPWSRVEIAFARREGWAIRLEDADGNRIHEHNIQRARLPVQVH